ncbi:hypothetical protein Gasu2_52820 [Galdieria sulphuraria]|nr:hypothetical protein Gasu2_52820 [Galdieria sulphuraria]
MEEEHTSSDRDSFAMFYNQGLREGIMEAQENLTRLGYWEGLKSVSPGIKLLNKNISELLVLESLNQKGLLLTKENPSFLGQQIKETRKQLENLLHKYESTLLELGSKYVQNTQHTSYVFEQNSPIEETLSLEVLKQSWFSQLEQHERYTLQEAHEGIAKFVNSLDESLQSCYRNRLSCAVLLELL